MKLSRNRHEQNRKFLSLTPILFVISKRLGIDKMNTIFVRLYYELRWAIFKEWE